MRSRWPRTILTAFAVLVLAGMAAAPRAGAADNLATCEQEFLRVVDLVRPSVVTVIAYSNLGTAEGAGSGADALKKSVGSGVVLDGEGHILTTTSVVGTSRNLFVRTSDGGERPAVFLGADHETALALLKVRPDGLAPARLGEPGELKPGSWAIVVAESFGHFPRYAFGAFTGVAVGSNPQADPGLLQMSAQVYPGNAGGAVANTSGEVVGVVRGATSVVEDGAAGGALGAPVGPTLSVAIPIDRAGQVAAELATHGSLAPGYLGVKVSTAAPALKDLLNFESGVIILGVLPGSPAEASGIEAGDVILSFGGQAMAKPSELAQLVARARPGERRDVELLRGDVHLTRAVTIGMAPSGGEVDRRAAEEERRRLHERIDEVRRELEALEERLRSR